MTLQATTATTASARQTTARLGFWSAVLLAIFTAVSFGIAINTLPISGPFCLADCISYPYYEVAAYVPHDYIWMMPAALMTPLFLVLMACIHHHTADSRKLFSLIGLAFAAICTTLISLDYFIQLTVMQPSILKGEMEGLVLFSQYNPHGIFIALEDLGYLMMSLTFLFTGAALGRPTKLERTVRWLFTISGVLAFAGLAVYSLVYGYDLEYRFEVFIISVNWLALLVSGVLLAILFWRAERQA